MGLAAKKAWFGAASRLDWCTMQALLIQTMDHFRFNNGPLLVLNALGLDGILNDFENETQWV